MFSVIGLMVATLGNTAMAAHQIAFNVWDVVYMPLISIGSAMATRIGHAIGAGDRRGVFLSCQCGGLLTLAVATLCMLVLLTTPEPIISAYTTDNGIRTMVLALLRLAVLFILLDAVQVAASFTLRAFKETRYPFLVMCLAYWLFTLPLGYWWGLQVADNPLDGTLGFWRAMILGIAVSSILIVSRVVVILRRPLPAGSPAED